METIAGRKTSSKVALTMLQRGSNRLALEPWFDSTVLRGLGMAG